MTPENPHHLKRLRFLIDINLIESYEILNKGFWSRQIDFVNIDNEKVIYELKRTPCIS